MASLETAGGAVAAGVSLLRSFPFYLCYCFTAQLRRSLLVLRGLGQTTVADAVTTAFTVSVVVAVVLATL